MATFFNFNNTSDTTSGIAGNSTLTYSESGVNFTLSLQNGDGANFMSIGSGSVIMSRSTGTNAPSQDVYVLDVTGAGQTRFDGTIFFNVATLDGSFSVNGQPVVLGSNTIAGPQVSLQFTASGPAQSLTIGSLTADINCFLSGTHIATPEGLRAVESLRPGDLIFTAEGTTTTVKWLGRQPIDTALSHPAKINPICITAGALGDNLPERDLHLSPDHAIALDGCLINAAALVNGTTIYQVADMPLDGFTYYHVETDAHELILAEGVATETFLELTGTDTFVNWDERDERSVAPMDLPRMSTARLVPDSIRAELAARAAWLSGKKAA